MEMNIGYGNLAFNAKYIDTTVIKKRKGLSYKPINVSIVEFNRNNEFDNGTLRTVISKYREMIRHMLYKEAQPEEHIFGITTQKDNFEIIDSDSVLGIMKYHSEGDNVLFISNLQTDPSYKFRKLQIFRKYKGIGKALIDQIKSVKEGKTLVLKSSKSAKRFYKKQGFQHDEKKYNDLMFYK